MVFNNRGVSGETLLVRIKKKCFFLVPHHHVSLFPLSEFRKTDTYAASKELLELVGCQPAQIMSAGHVSQSYRKPKWTVHKECCCTAGIKLQAPTFFSMQIHRNMTSSGTCCSDTWLNLSFYTRGIFSQQNGPRLCLACSQCNLSPLP